MCIAPALLLMLGSPDGTIVGVEQLRPYFAEGIEKVANLHLELHFVLEGVAGGSCRARAACCAKGSQQLNCIQHREWENRHAESLLKLLAAGALIALLMTAAPHVVMRQASTPSTTAARQVRKWWSASSWTQRHTRCHMCACTMRQSADVDELPDPY